MIRTDIAISNHCWNFSKDDLQNVCLSAKKKEKNFMTVILILQYLEKPSYRCTKDALIALLQLINVPS